MRLDVICPAAPWENTTTDADRAWDLCFDLSEEVKVTKTGLKKILGRKLAARVLKTWHEDFVDEDTGEVVSIERNEIVLDRDTILEKEHIDLILETDVKTVLLHKENNAQSDYAIIHNTLQKDPTNSEKEAVEHIYRQLRNAEPPDEETARGIIDKLFFSDQRYNLGEVGRYRMNKKLGLDIGMEKQVTKFIVNLVKEYNYNGYNLFIRWHNDEAPPIPHHVT